MRQRPLIHLAIATLASFGLSLSASAKSTYTTIDPPQSMYAYPTGISAGVVAGYYQDTGAKLHGFVRATDGTITSFDPTGSDGPYVTGINSGGAITGYYDDSSYRGHGFVRAADGTITSVEPQGAVSSYAWG